jgi:Ca2+-binding EF-hand superfamily protein
MKNPVIKISILFAVFLSFSQFSFAKGRDAGLEKGQHRERPQRPAFSTLDLDGDGSVVLEEFKRQPIKRRSHEEIFGHIDADADGVISEQEFNSHKPPRRAKRDRNKSN